MRKLTAIGLLIAVAGLTGCSGMNVYSDHDPTAISDMQAYKTYAWLPDTKGGQHTHNTLESKRIKHIADGVLAEKGYALATSSQPDFYVGWHGAIDRKLAYNTVNTYYGYGWGYWGGYGGTSTYVTEYQQGSLIIDIVDVKTNELVWRGVAQAEVYPQADQDYRNRQIETAVNKILGQFPPK
jgi:hypothetical protein